MRTLGTRLLTFAVAEGYKGTDDTRATKVRLRYKRVDFLGTATVLQWLIWPHRRRAIATVIGGLRLRDRRH